MKPTGSALKMMTHSDISCWWVFVLNTAKYFKLVECVCFGLCAITSIYRMFFWSSSDSWQLRIYYIPWPAKKLLPKIPTQTCLPKTAKNCAASTANWPKLPKNELQKNILYIKMTTEFKSKGSELRYLHLEVNSLYLRANPIKAI